jgi:cell wall assembly regulator SMI1
MLRRMSDSVSKCYAAVRSRIADLEAMQKLPPATDAQIVALEKTIGLHLPLALTDWLKRLNGNHHGFCLSAGWSFLSTDEITMHWRFFSDEKQGIAPIVEHTDHPDRVKVPANHKTRIPIAADYSGNLLVIDTDPVSAEFFGQVLFILRDSHGASFVVFNSFNEMLEALAQQLARKDIALLDGNIRFAKNDGMLRPWYVRARPFRNPPWIVTEEVTSFVAALTPQQRNACYAAQNDLLQTESFGPHDLDLIRSIVVNKELAENPNWLLQLSFLQDVRVDCDATPSLFSVLAKLKITKLYLQPATPNGLTGIDRLRAHSTIKTMSAMRVDQTAFDIMTTMPSLIQLHAIASEVNNISSIKNAPQLRTLYINDVGQPDVSPAYMHPSLKEFSLTWRQPISPTTDK